MDVGRALDRAIGVVAPRLALARGQARMALAATERAGELARRFEGATMGRRAAAWVNTSGSQDNELRRALSILRARARDLTNNNSWAASAVSTLQTDLAGTGIMWRPRSLKDLEAKLPQGIEDKVKRLWLSWTESKNCDLRGRHNFYTLQSICARELIEAGEFIVRRVWTGDPIVPFRLQTLEPDHLDTMKDGWLLDNGGQIVQGIEFDRFGKRVAYHLFREHPGDIGYGFNLTSERVLAEDVLHVFEEQRIGQSRGLPRGTACMLKLRDQDEVEDAVVVAQKIANCFVGIIHDLSGEMGALAPTPIGEPSTVEATPDGGLNRRFTPGMFQTLPPGKSITFGQPPTVVGFKDVTKINLQAVAASFRSTYERITCDLERTNYSSARTGSVKYFAQLDTTTWHTLVPDLCDGVFGWFMEWATEIAAVLPPDQIGAAWTPPKRAMVDPRLEVPPAIAAIRAGLTSRSEVVRESGQNVEEIERQLADENKRADLLKLSLDSDGRRPLNAPFEEPPDENGDAPKKDANKTED